MDRAMQGVPEGETLSTKVGLTVEAAAASVEGQSVDENPSDDLPSLAEDLGIVFPEGFSEWESEDSLMTFILSALSCAILLKAGQFPVSADEGCRIAMAVWERILQSDDVSTLDLLAVKPYLATALDLFSYWSICSQECLLSQGTESALAKMGAYLLSALLAAKGGGRFRLMLWQSVVFRSAFKNMIEKMRVTRSRARDCFAEFGLLRSLEEDHAGNFFTVPQEAVVALNPPKGSGEPASKVPASFHLIRSFVWIASELAQGKEKGAEEAQHCPNTPLHLWAWAAGMIKNLSLRSAFYTAAASAFADSDANDDALRLFKMAISGWEKDGLKVSNAAEARLEREREFSEKMGRCLKWRMLAIQCTLANPGVAKHLQKKKVKILAAVKKLRDMFSESSKKGSDGFAALLFFITWLEGATLLSKNDRTESGHLECLRDRVGGVDLQKVPAADLFPVLNAAAVEDFEADTGEKVRDTFQLSKKEKRENTPLPCAICGVCEPSFMYCAVCKLVVYCGKACQKKDWNRKPGGHKKRCALLKANATDILVKESEARSESQDSFKGQG
uniref:MYND-type domain-containing protein n=1 Tax=Chromera velia CCMP2878 TaxID=1169474 RepID=A0A0G4GRI7_9ALVE|eukprot:Cvel_5070.t1-p1 / transcript=Cvel_5070.t1 / gene=Cvel_5070 / organism=Chromera_velia_CCMP2878 / gene_product=hypothetical protein / transcript_product=hypothetical protein / location=Cvel_scaffold231:36029-37705(-) / protein_length=559 / sequence_SO=supercontig / SO=protein_coding / is_pseudo=false